MRHEQQIVAAGTDYLNPPGLDDESRLFEWVSDLHGDRCEIRPDDVALRIDQTKVRCVFSMDFGEMSVDFESDHEGKLRYAEPAGRTDKDILALAWVMQDLAANEEGTDERYRSLLRHGDDLTIISETVMKIASVIDHR